MPHLVVPGVMFSARPALIMALLATIVGVPFLLEPARVVLENAKGSWIDIDVPENISYEFARLVLKGSPNDLAVRLNDEEKAVYEGMGKYKLLELNLGGALTASTGWTPSKSREVGDDQVECKSCKIKRSKTVMRNDPESAGVCAACWDTEMDPKSLAEQGDEEACWVECSAKTCRAQYVIMNPQALNVSENLVHSDESLANSKLLSGATKVLVLSKHPALPFRGMHLLPKPCHHAGTVSKGPRTNNLPLCRVHHQTSADHRGRRMQPSPTRRRERSRVAGCEEDSRRVYQEIGVQACPGPHTGILCSFGTFDQRPAGAPFEAHSRRPRPDWDPLRSRE